MTTRRAEADWPIALDATIVRHHHTADGGSTSGDRDAPAAD
ncbi:MULTISPECIES: hypothetical protein [Streptomyces]